MKLIFMGTPDFAVPAIDALIAAGHDIAAVFSQPDKPKGRGYTLTPPPVKVRALEHGIPVWQPASMRDGEALKIFEEIQPDVAVVIAYGRILPKEILDTPKYGCINVHASLLPRYRGAAPIQWSVIDGEAVTGVTTQQMDVGLDTGDILMTSETPIDPDETAGELHDRLSEMSAKLIVDTLAALEKGELHPQKQDDAQSCYARMLTKELCAVDWQKDAQTIHNQIRGLSPWPVAVAVLEGKKLKLHRSAVSDLSDDNARCGEVICLEPFTVQCGNHTAIELLEIQAEGKKRMTTQDYLRGHKIALGTVLQ
ncbi:MAG: methionyl-tRNA formyltransferase [Clostridia bacterium]|nr:methionyl-tRNA formyltransferase [Clostridia bacterium]